jgi:hypothetical protein
VAAYPRLSQLVRSVDPRTPETGFNNIVIPYLVDVWLDDYSRANRRAEVVETTDAGFSYLFDLTDQRLISA